ncbi:glycosyltransferase family 25 protein [Photobacterium atrarenae]|uniref:Glycosyltransferase family 25 protein n=1 Tax=Photobacterium atrarenae TaxID=865757 RepID=A0ABY5GF75_9GAMM|nr:glycosyltransferase family 25 protein [Photobacterium atrarenae]UTV27905.1 glycosyltransferase family 25 protein [Photobacterium atrarenae]
MTIPTFVVSLARSSDRRQQMQAVLEQAGIPFEFFDAIDGTTSAAFRYSEKAAPEITFKRKGYHLTPAEVACFASHYALWEKCVDLGEPILILEDNISICSDLKSILTAVMPYIAQCQFIKLTATHPRKYSAKFKLSKTHSIGLYHKGTAGTGGYIITPTAAKSFLENAQQFIEPIDDYVEKTWRHGIKAYHIYPSVLERSPAQSTIGNCRKQKQAVGLCHKLYMESFRVYETLMRKLTSLT